MKKILTALLVCLSLLSLGFSTVAEAKRFGGGRSIGFQRQVPTTPRQMQTPRAPQQQAMPNAARPGTPNATQPQNSGWRRWAGPLAGIAAGLGLAALFSHLGIGSGMGGMLILILGAVFLFVVLRKLFGAMQAPQARPAYAGPTDKVVRPFEAQAAMPEQGSGTSSAQFPAGFDAEAFTHQAKVNFIRLQAANDAGNLDDIREFTSPEMFAEIKLEMDQRGTSPQRTDIVLLEAEVLEVAEEAQHYLASVRFYGSLRESADQAPQDFDEVWHLSKPRDGSRGWTVAGIQQIN